MLVSGGFTFFTDRLQTRLGLDYTHANLLDTDNGRLTGRLNGRIIDAQAKADLLREYRTKLGLHHRQVLAVGDGANDIPMLTEAGFGIAYHAKPKARQAATYASTTTAWKPYAAVFYSGFRSNRSGEHTLPAGTETGISGRPQTLPCRLSAGGGFQYNPRFCRRGLVFPLERHYLAKIRFRA